jgi:O-antigen ligase/polysaccharide polymerase Wzy-like membrane protein
VAAATVFDTGKFSTSWIESTQRRRMAVLVCAVIVASLSLVRLVLAFDMATVSGFLLWAALVALIIRPRYGLYTLFGLELGFETASGDQMMTPGGLMNASLQQSIGATGLILVPMEIMLLLVTTVWLATELMNRYRRAGLRAGDIGKPMFLFGLLLIVGVLRGLAQEGIFNFAFWESRFLFWMVLCYVLAVNTIRTRGHIRALLALVFVWVTWSAAEGMWRKIALVDNGLLGNIPETYYSHEDVVIWGLLMMLVFARLAFGGSKWQVLLGPIALIIAGYTMLASERRAGYIAVMVAFGAFALVLWIIKRKAFMLIAVPILIGTAIYMPLFWNNTSMLGQPARAVRSLRNPDPRDAASNMARDLEAINVRATIQSNLLLGVGFGRPFLQVVPIPDISFFPFWNYEAHHDILWVWMKVGVFGFILFFIVMCRGLARAAALMRKIRDPDARVFASLAMSAILMSLVFCWVDLGLTNPRVPVVLGVMLGGLAVLERIYMPAPETTMEVA